MNTDTRQGTTYGLIQQWMCGEPLALMVMMTVL